MKEYLENIQLGYLKDRYGENYKGEIERLAKQTLMSEDFSDKFKSHFKLSDNDLNQLMEYTHERYANIKVINTKYSLLSHDFVFDFYFQKISETVAKLNYYIKEVPFAGTAITKEFNAFACSHPITHEKLIIFEGELLVFANQFCKLIASSLPFETTSTSVILSTDIEIFKDHLKKNASIQERFDELIYHTIYRGLPSKSKPYFIDNSLFKVYFEFLNSFELFIVGHEYGHVLAGHLDGSCSMKKIASYKFNLIETNWNNEYEADSIGLRLLLNSLDNSNLAPYCYVGPELFFLLIDLLSRISSYMINGTEIRDQGSKSHPPAINRKIEIQKHFEHSLNCDDYIGYKMLINLIDSIIEILWENLKSKIRKR